MTNDNISSTDLMTYADEVRIIKQAIQRARYRSLASVNREALSLYFGVGKFVSECAKSKKWGSKAIPSISESLRREMPGLTGFSVSGIKRMRQFYEEWAPVICGSSIELEFGPTAVDQISPLSVVQLHVDENLLLNEIRQPIGNEFDWADFARVSFTHHMEIIAKIKNLDARFFYIHQCALHAWSKETLKEYIHSDLYIGRGTMPSNFAHTITDAQYAAKAVMSFKDSYLLDMVNVEDVGEKSEDWDEKVIEHQIVDNIRDFVLRFGKDFLFVDSQHRLIVADEEMKADLVFFNRDLNATVIIELKRGKFRHTYLGQLNDYLTAFNRLERKPHENPPIGIILCRDVNRKLVEFLVSDYSNPMGVAKYSTRSDVPEQMRNLLPDMQVACEMLPMDEDIIRD